MCPQRPQGFEDLRFDDSDELEDSEEVEDWHDNDVYVYSEDEAVAAITGYYAFLTKMYMNESSVMYPPPGGWPEIVNADPAKLRALGKSDAVLSLLAHLPYIRQRDDTQPIPSGSFNNWPHLIRDFCTHDSTPERVRLLTEGCDFMHLSTSHVFGLACGPYEDCPVIVLDTKLGLVQWELCPPEVEMNDSGYEDVNWDPNWNQVASREERVWREEAMAWTIPDFFGVLKYQLRELRWVPVGARTLRTVSENDDGGDEAGMMPMLKDIYHRHGWPDLAIYRKTECLAAVEKAMAENFPSSGGD